MTVAGANATTSASDSAGLVRVEVDDADAVHAVSSTPGGRPSTRCQSTTESSGTAISVRVVPGLTCVKANGH
jgi:hypothetical protein